MSEKLKRRIRLIIFKLFFFIFEQRFLKEIVNLYFFRCAKKIVYFKRTKDVLFFLFFPQYVGKGLFFFGYLFRFFSVLPSKIVERFRLGILILSSAVWALISLSENHLIW